MTMGVVCDQDTSILRVTRMIGTNVPTWRLVLADAPPLDFNRCYTSQQIPKYPIGYQAIRKQTHLYIWQNHAQYGVVVRYGPNRLLFNSAQDIYQNPKFTKPHLYAFSHLGGGSSIFSTIGEDHHHQKRYVCAQALSDRSMRMFEPTILGISTSSWQSFRNHATAPCLLK
ncbi:hypothetical protein F5Y05DRAFT_230239 [Hypoxylon sp. FL0543]|nr:hypothetical protein F5Y05DRAFT_230239 [Hypoxylon sp. FL0543]